PAQATLQFDALSPLGGMDYFLESSPDPSSPSWERIAQDLQITPSGSSARYRLVTPVPRNNEPTLFFRARARFQE
ncbi:MAG: hypothetical protein OSA48_10975, partial [Akkermansiaceae bacterium]|nr:hypothetical protein [Akkermansiaceae bacterium]